MPEAVIPSTPSLGSMVLTRDGVWRDTYRAVGDLPLDTAAWVQVTDRSGGVLATLDGDVGANRVDWTIDPAELADIPAGSNFEMFIETEEGVHKVRYGRVVRREVAFPLAPTSSDMFDAVMYEDQLQRSEPGPYWIPKYGKVGMFTQADPKPDFAMAVRNADFFLPLPLWADAAVLWYAPARSDTVEITFGLVPAGAGQTTIVLASNYQMTSYLGIMFDTNPATDIVRCVTGTGPIATVNQGASVNHNIATNGGIYTVKYSLPLNTMSLYVGSNLTPLIEFEDTSHLATHGLGYQYFGASWQASLFESGPRMYYFKAKDDV